jgi:hypothetical protein
MGLKVSPENYTVKIHLGDVGVHGKIMLKLIFDSCGRREMSPAGDRV